MSNKCCICQESICISDKYKCTKCNNILHKSCLINWLENGDGCPICRHNIKISNIYKPTICCIVAFVFIFLLNNYCKV